MIRTTTTTKTRLGNVCTAIYKKAEKLIEIHLGHPLLHHYALASVASSAKADESMARTWFIAESNSSISLCFIWLDSILTSNSSFKCTKVLNIWVASWKWRLWSDRCSFFICDSCRFIIWITGVLKASSLQRIDKRERSWGWYELRSLSS